MARRSKKARTPRRPSAPPPVPRSTPSGARRTPSRPASGVAAKTPAAKRAEENLNETYAHVRKDLMRIAVLGTIMIAAILASQFVL